MTLLSVLAADTAVDPGLINAAGLVVGLGGIVLAAVWLHYLYR